MRKQRIIFLMCLAVLIGGLCGGGIWAQAGASGRIGQLIAVLENPRATANEKGNACEQLMEFGPQAKAAVPALLDLLRSPEEILRDYAVTTLTKIGPEAKAALPALKRVAAQDPSPDIRELAQGALRQLGGSGAATPNAAAPPKPGMQPVTAAGNKNQPKNGATAPQSPAPAKQNRIAPNAPGQWNSAAMRPPLEAHQGQYFRWACPRGWRASETMSGVSLYSPDQKQSAAFALLMRSYGQTTPDRFLVSMMQRVPQYSNIRIAAVRNLPNQPSGIPGTYWRVMEITVQYTVNGLPVTGLWTCGINAYYNMYDAVIVGYYAATPEWQKDRLYLPEISRSITITNPRQVAGNDQLIPAKNNPLDNSGLLESWRQKGLSEDRISQATREGTSGYERLKDPQTGQIYEMPLEAYDGTAGGYRNPYRPTEILQHADPGE